MGVRLPNTVLNLPRLTILAASFAATFGAAIAARADSYDVLLEKLRAKGVISDSEYDEFKTLRDEDVKAAEKAAKGDDSTLIGKFKDGFTWESADKQHAFSVNGRIQGDYRAFQDNASPNTFDVRRAYLGAKGKLYNDITFNVTGDFAQSSGNAGASSGAVQLDEGYVNFGWFKPAQLRIGQLQMPYSLEKITSDLYNNFQERWIGDVMSPDKLRGAMVHGSPGTGLYYGLGLSNGNGSKNTNDVNPVVDGKELIGRVAVNLAEMLNEKRAIYHFGVSYADTTLPPGSATFTARTEARGLNFFSSVAFSGSNTQRKQTGFETALAYGPFKLQAEGSTSNFTGTSAGGIGYDRDINGYYASLVWMITGENYADSYSGGVFSRVRPKSNFNGRSGLGAWEVGLRYTKWDAGDFTAANAAGTGVLSAGATNRADAMTVGLKWIVNPNTRLLLNYVQTNFDTPVTVPVSNATVDEEKAVTLRAQLDF